MASRKFSKFGKRNRDFACNGKMLVNKNHKYCKNNKFSKEKKGKVRKAKEGPWEAANLANLAKVTRILPATAKCLLSDLSSSLLNMLFLLYVPLQIKSLLLLLYLLNSRLAEGPLCLLTLPFCCLAEFVILAIFAVFVNKVITVADKTLVILLLYLLKLRLAEGPLCLCHLRSKSSR